MVHFWAIKDLLVLPSPVAWWVSISTFASLINFYLSAASSATTIKICVITAGMKIISQQLRKIKIIRMRYITSKKEQVK